MPGRDTARRTPRFAGPEQGTPGKPAVRAPSAAEPTEPHGPLPPKPDQTGPGTVSPTGQPTGADQARRAQSGSRLTNAQGTRLYDTDHSLDGGMVPLVVAPTGGTLGPGPDAPAVQRTYATARSVEFDALLVAGAPGIGVDAYGAQDAKAGLPAGGNGAPPTRGWACCSRRRTGTARPSVPPRAGRSRWRRSASPPTRPV